MKKEETNQVKYLGNYYGYGCSYDGTVIDREGICNALLASNSHGNVPKIVERKDNEQQR